MDLESVAKELKMLAGRERLTATELDRAKELMRQLKATGTSNQEIVELTAGRWSESTVKGYTKGVRATDPAPWQSTTALFSEMLAKNLTLDDVSSTTIIKAEAESVGWSLHDVVSFISDIKKEGADIAQLKQGMEVKADLKQAGTSPVEMAGFMKQLEAEGIDAPTFVSVLREWREAGLTAEGVQTVLKHKSQLEQAGLDIGTESYIAEVAAGFGSSAEVLQALEKYTTLIKLDEEIETRRKELNSISKAIESGREECAGANKRLEAVEKKRGAAEKELAILKRLEANGFDEKTLKEIDLAADKYGNPEKVLAALNAFGGLCEIEAASKETRAKIQLDKITLEEMESKQSHLKSATEMCQELLFKYEFGFDVITAILTLAEVYGDPIKVLGAVESYGKLKALDEGVRQREARIEVLKKTETQYQARVVTALEQFEHLNVRAIEVGRALGIVEEQLKQNTRARDVLILLQNPIAASFEPCVPLVLVLIQAVRVWVNQNKERFRLFYNIDRGLDDLTKNLGGS